MQRLSTNRRLSFKGVNNLILKTISFLGKFAIGGATPSFFLDGSFLLLHKVLFNFILYANQKKIHSEVGIDALGSES